MTQLRDLKFYHNYSMNIYKWNSHGFIIFLLAIRKIFTLKVWYIKILLKTFLGVSSKKDNSWCLMSSATAQLRARVGKVGNPVKLSGIRYLGLGGSNSKLLPYDWNAVESDVNPEHTYKWGPIW